MRSALLLFLLLAATGAAADPATDLGQARRLVREGRLQPAITLLAPLETSAPGAPDTAPPAGLAEARRYLAKLRALDRIEQALVRTYQDSGKAAVALAIDRLKKDDAFAPSRSSSIISTCSRSPSSSSRAPWPTPARPSPPRTGRAPPGAMRGRR